MNRILIPLVLFLSSISCKQIDDPKIQFLKWAQKGVTTDNVKCKVDQSQSYCIYLPSTYSPSTNYPTIYAFDPHGKGSLPVNLLKNIAEKLGYIVIGSNSSRNGLRLEEINSIVGTLFSDTQQKLAIDPNRIYLFGFSGGARVASMIASGSAGIKGVIACSAGFQPERKPLGFHFIGIAGTQDMNYLEMRQLNNILDSAQIPNQLITFKGKHQWPNESTLSEAVTMLELYTMKSTNASVNKKIVDDYLNKNINRIQNLKSNNCVDSLALAYSISARTIQVLDGLSDISRIKTIQEELSQMQNLQQYQKEKISLEIFESTKQKEFISAFSSKPDTWWNNEIKQLNREGSGLKGDVSKRLLGYISLSCYGYVNSALHYQDWKAAKYFTSIYRQVDPENPDSWYALACLQANTESPEIALESLKTAIKYGYSDYVKIKNDPLLNRIRGLKEFNSITKK